jgi:RNA polymerase sigma-70 factor (ECF subfamily)
VTLSEHDQQMVRRAMTGDEKAFTFLVGQFSRLVYTHAYTLLGSRQEAEDVTQECFLRAFQFRIRLQDPAKFPQWLLAIARNLALDRYRQHHEVVSLDDPTQPQPAEEATPLPLAAMATRERQAEVVAALEKLPARYRDAVTMRYLEGYDHQAIRQQLHVSDGALRGILGRALVRLRNLLGPKEKDV